MIYKFFDTIIGTLRGTGMDRYYDTLSLKRHTGMPTIDEARKDYQAMVRHHRRVMP